MAVLPFLLAFSTAPAISPVQARRASDFLGSLGANSAINMRGERLEKTIECARYLGLRWFRSGIEGSPSMSDLLELHRKAGVRYSWSPGSGGSDLEKLLATAHELAKSDALLAFEGPNEPNNWGISYKGEFGGRDKSWKAVAHFQRDLYARVKADSILKKYPVWGISETGAEVDNVGLQFLKIPNGASIAMPDGTKYADAANVHNYIYHPNSPNVEDNKTWNASDPTSACKVDGLFGNHGRTWGRKYEGYSERELIALPKVTTETGSTVEGPVTEEIQALNLMSLYLDQFKRGWSHTAVYLLRDRVDEAGNQSFGFFRPDYSPRKSAFYLHNLTTILADKENAKKLGRFAYEIPNRPATVHDLLLQKSDGSFALVVWSELVKGSNPVTVRFGASRTDVELYDPTMGTEPAEILGERDTVRLTLTDHPVVIEIPASSKR